MNEKELAQVLKKKGYGIKSGIKSSIGEESLSAQIKRTRQKHDLEPDLSDESLRAEKLQIGYSGKVRVVITFYRRRLADYSRAISEKALVDCLQYAGLISGDSEKEIWLEDGGQQKVATDAEERTEIVIHYPEVDLDNLWVKAQDHKNR